MKGKVRQSAEECIRGGFPAARWGGGPRTVNLHRRVYRSTLGLRVITKMKRKKGKMRQSAEECIRGGLPAARRGSPTRKYLRLIDFFITRLVYHFCITQSADACIRAGLPAAHWDGGPRTVNLHRRVYRSTLGLKVIKKMKRKNGKMRQSAEALSCIRAGLPAARWGLGFGGWGCRFGFWSLGFGGCGLRYGVWGDEFEG